MYDEDHDDGDVDELFDFVFFFGRAVYRRAQVDLEQVDLSFVQSFELVFTDPCEHDVLRAEKAQDKVEEGLVTHGVERTTWLESE